MTRILRRAWYRLTLPARVRAEIDAAARRHPSGGPR